MFILEQEVEVKAEQEIEVEVEQEKEVKIETPTQKVEEIKVDTPIKEVEIKQKGLNIVNFLIPRNSISAITHKGHMVIALKNESGVLISKNFIEKLNSNNISVGIEPSFIYKNFEIASNLESEVLEKRGETVILLMKQKYTFTPILTLEQKLSKFFG